MSMGSPRKWASALALIGMGIPSVVLAQGAEAEEEAQAEETTAADQDDSAEENSASAQGSVDLGLRRSGAQADAQAETVAAQTEAQEEAAEAEAAKEEETDHSAVVGRFGVGLLGGAQASYLSGSGFSTATLNLPLIGARYWLTEGLGIQAGFGLSHRSGENNQSTLEYGVDHATLWAGALHVGVPLVLYHEKHYKFLVQPEANFLLVTGRTNDNQNFIGDSGVSLGGWGLDLGARVGAEVHFGFIGLPKLSLQGSVGAAYSLRQSFLETRESGRLVKRTRTENGISTANYNDPWDLFTSSIAALYYF